MNRKDYARLQQLLYHAAEGGLGDYGEREELKELVDQLRADEREVVAKLTRARRMVNVLAKRPFTEGPAIAELVNAAIRGKPPQAAA